MTTHPLRTIGLILAAAGIGPWALGAGLAAPIAEAQSYVTVIDSENKPVLGLSQEDFLLRDGAVRQAILSVESPAAPLAVAVVIDGFETADAEVLARAIGDAARRLAAADPSHQIGIVSGAPGSGSTLVPVTQNSAPAAVSALLATPAGARAGFIDALVDACRLLRAAPTDCRAVLAITRQPAGRAVVPAQPTLSDALLVGKVGLWTIDVGGTDTSKSPRDRLLIDGADLSGALRQTPSSTAALTEAAGRVADLLVSQYLVTYVWPNPVLSQVNIALRHDRGVVLAPIWTR